MAALLGSSSSLSQASFGRSRRFGADPSLAPYYREAWPADVLWLRANQRAVPRVKLLSPSNGRAGRVSLFLTLGDEMQPGGRWIRLPQRTRRRLPRWRLPKPDQEEHRCDQRPQIERWKAGFPRCRIHGQSQAPSNRTMLSPHPPYQLARLNTTGVPLHRSASKEHLGSRSPVGPDNGPGFARASRDPGPTSGIATVSISRIERRRRLWTRNHRRRSAHLGFGQAGITPNPGLDPAQQPSVGRPAQCKPAPRPSNREQMKLRLVNKG
jgi:hypothetical protein